MILTRMELDPQKRRCAMALSSPNLFHGAIERAFEGRSRHLWRIDTLRGVPYLLLVSEEKPDLSSAAAQFGTERGWESRSYDPFLAQIRDGDRRRFRLAANPVIKKSAEGTILAHTTVEYQEKWLLDRAEKNGFHLSPDEFLVTESKWYSFRKGSDGGRTVTFRMAVYEGILIVTDAERFREMLCTGIGREKAYGCGLMTVLGNEA